MESKPLQIAVSYSHDDVACVIPDVERLAAKGINIWLDRSITGGAMWREEIAQHFGDAEVVLAFVSARWVASEYCRQEISFALDQGKPILCVYLEDTQLTPGLQMSLNHRQTIQRYLHSHDLDGYYALVRSALIGLNDAHNQSLTQQTNLATQMTTRMFPSSLQLVYDGSEYAVSDQSERRFTLGRSSGCNLVLKSDFVSRVHGYFYFENRKYYYRDSSSNGTQLLSNGQDLHLQQAASELAKFGQLVIGGAVISYHTH